MARDSVWSAGGRCRPPGSDLFDDERASAVRGVAGVGVELLRVTAMSRSGLAIARLAAGAAVVVGDEGWQVARSRMQERDESTAAAAWPSASQESVWKAARREEGLEGCAAMVVGMVACAAGVGSWMNGGCSVCCGLLGELECVARCGLSLTQDAGDCFRNELNLEGVYATG